MILQIWLKLFAIVLLALVPLMAGQYFMEKESIELVFNMATKSNTIEFMDSHMAQLKKLSQLDPENSEMYRSEFERAVDTRNVVKDLGLVRHSLTDDILMQTVRNTLLLMLAALVATLFLARSIVALLRRLIAENQVQSLRLERLSALESWQRVARMMVHEMRAPITPIKLVATDMESKFHSLDSGAFQQYMERGTELIRAQVTSIERLTDSLTKFAKLPDVHKQSASLPKFLREFVESYREYGAGLVQLQYVSSEGSDLLTAFDANLLSLLFFNLLKNAVEANLNRAIQVQIKSWQKAGRTWVSFHNSGSTIPSPMAEELFKLHVSSKSDSSGSNFGVGLTIAKKIALDHNGDLSLTKNDSEAGVIFELELPSL
jgi:nitrogen fixation/metabolism regulation signal transduction histidine kinase